MEFAKYILLTILNATLGSAGSFIEKKICNIVLFAVGLLNLTLYLDIVET